MTQTLAEIINAIKADPENAKYTAQGIDPLFNCDPEATILIIGQAPGRIAQEKRIFWDDPSGDRRGEGGGDSAVPRGEWKVYGD